MKLKTNIAMKYHMNAHRLCASYPNETDVIYDIISYVFTSNKRKKNWKPEDMHIKLDEFKSVFPDIGDDKFKETIRTILSTLHKNNYITIADGNLPDERVIAITTEGLSKLYEI